MISSANSLGFMDGGSDLGYMHSISNIQNFVQNGIKKLQKPSQLGRFYLPIGDTMGFNLPTNPNISFIVAPTMLLPQNVKDSDNQYFALKSALQLCKSLQIKKIYTPMMCTNWGGYDYKTSYNIMMTAINDYDKHSNNHIEYIDNYVFNLSDNQTRLDILNKQPKNYMNTEFGISIYDLF